MRREHCPCCGKVVTTASLVWEAIKGGARSVPQIVERLPKTDEVQIWRAISNLTRRNRIKRVSRHQYEVIVPVKAGGGIARAQVTESQYTGL